MPMSAMALFQLGSWFNGAWLMCNYTNVIHSFLSFILTMANTDHHLLLLLFKVSNDFVCSATSSYSCCNSLDPTTRRTCLFEDSARCSLSPLLLKAAPNSTEPWQSSWPYSNIKAAMIFKRSASLPQPLVYYCDQNELPLCLRGTYCNTWRT